MRKLMLVLILLSLVINTNVYAETLKIHGSLAVMGTIILKIKEPFEKASGIELVISGNGSGAGAKDLAAGKCDASVASESLENLKKFVPELAGIHDLREHKLGNDTIAVIVSNQNPVTKLSKEQVKGLNIGKIKNWKEVGGMDADVIVVTSVKGSGTRQMLQEMVMDGEAYATDAIEKSSTIAELREVSSMKEAIGAVSDALLNGTVKKVDTPQIGRPLIMVTKGEPGPALKKLIDFILGEGQKYLK